MNHPVGPVVAVRLPDDTIKAIDETKPARMPRAAYLREIIIGMFNVPTRDIPAQRLD